MSQRDREENRLSARAARYARVGANMGGFAARMAGARLFGSEGSQSGNAVALARALGGLKGPLMKVAQLLATIPDVLPPEYAEELSKLQSQAPPMGWAFVKRRMMAELGPTGPTGSARSSGRRRPQPRSGRFTAPPPRTARGSPASCNMPTWNPPSRRTSPSSRCYSPSTAAWIPPSIPARSTTRSASECARSSTTAARPGTPPSTATCSAGST